jgi:hypothetical protein
MNIFAQHGAAEGEKIIDGLERGCLDGVVYSPKDVSLANLHGKLDVLANRFPRARRLFDPQLYASFQDAQSGARLGHLLDDEYRPYFTHRRRSELEREPNVVRDVQTALRFQAGLNLTAFVSPNILVPRSLNSIEAVICKTFLRVAKSCAAEMESDLPVYATLALSRNTLLDRAELVEFADEITMISPAPDGIYLLISADDPDSRYDIYNADVIAGWLFLNHILTISGIKVINGYSDLISPFLATAGAEAGCFGWWSNLRTFSLDRFMPANGGGRLPVPRYLSKLLLNRITFIELERLRRNFPQIVNGLQTDDLYGGTGSEPERNQEVLQSWEAVRSLIADLANPVSRLHRQNAYAAIRRARQTYEMVQGAPFRFDPKSSPDHLDALEEGLRSYESLAEL